MRVRVVGFTGPPFRALRTVGRLNPDIIIRSGNYDSIQAEVIESQRFQLKVSKPYESVLRQLSTAGTAVSEEESEHVRQYVQRVRQFISSIQQRRRTLQRLADLLVERQKNFCGRVFATCSR